MPPAATNSPPEILTASLSRRLAIWSLTLLALLFVSAVVGVALGTTRIPGGIAARAVVGSLPGLHGLLRPIPEESLLILREIRLPRVLLAGLVGGGLSCSGAALQGLLGNPLADPYIIGVSSGAAVGAALVLMLGYGAMLGGLAVPVAAFVTALLAMGVVLGLSRRGGRLPTQGFLLAGIVVGSFFWALVTLLLTLSGKDMQTVLFWLMGSFSGADWTRIGVSALFILGSGLGLLAYAKDLNLISTGEDAAIHLGVNVERSKTAVVLLAALATAASVSVSGVIAFVGLMAPHMTRRLTGSDHRILLPCSALLGAAFLILADTLSRTAFGSTEVPVGLLTALMGGPFFFLILRRQVKGP